MKLYIFRHGETFANVEKIVSDGYSSKVQLTDRGKEQALLLGNELQKLHLPIIYSSPYDRAHMTAQYVAQFNRTPINIMSDLHEFSFGIAEGKTEAEIYTKYNKEFTSILDVADEKTYQVRLPEGESKEEAVNRFSKAINYILANCPYDIAGVATHGHVMSLYYYHLYHELHSFKNCEYFVLDK